jgi:Multisubunit Na+/H+ antiporter, MnhE subunit
VITQFVVNLVIAVVWALLQDTLSWHNLVVGFFVGMVVLNFAVRRLEHPFYMHRVLAFLKLTLIFFAEVVRSGLRVSYLILHPKLPISPGLVAVPLDVTSDEAITMLAGMITMAPGSISIELSNDRKVLYVHALEAGDPHKAAAFFKNAFERHILEVFM